LIPEQSRKQEEIMIGKDKSGERLRKTDRSDADSRTKEAELEKASKEELRHMGDSEAAQAVQKQKQKETSK
jgi:hypothetical protein